MSHFPDAPALPGWNYDWESGGGWPSGNDAWFRVIFDPRIYNRYADAASERLSAAYGSYPGLLAPLDTFGAGDYSQLYSGGLAGWSMIQSIAINAPGFIQGYDGSGAQLDYSTPFSTIFPSPWDFDATSRSSRCRRKYPREILHLSDAGAEGQVARLADGSQSAGQLYRFTSGAWAADPSAAAPDVMSDVGPIQRGDYFGPWLLNDLRDLLNEMVVSIHLPKTVTETSSSGPSLAQGTSWQTHGEISSNFGSDAADYDSGAHLGALITFSPIQVGRTNLGSVLGVGVEQYYATTAYPVISEMLPALSRTVYFLVYTRSTFGDADVMADTYNSFGDGPPYLENQYVLVSTASASDVTYSGPKQGSLARPPVEGGYAAGVEPAWGTSDNSYLQSLGGPLAFIRWDVAGGFRFTKFTTGGPGGFDAGFSDGLG